MDKEPDAGIIELVDEIKREPSLEEDDFAEWDDDEPRFFTPWKKRLLIGGAVVLFLITLVAFLSSGRSGISKGDYDNLMLRLDRIEARLDTLAGKTEYHVVARGESLSLIARKYGLTIDALCNLNKITPRQPIYPGQKLLVSVARGS
jgi:LysM repeat protein